MDNNPNIYNGTVPEQGEPNPGVQTQVSPQIQPQQVTVEVPVQNVQGNVQYVAPVGGYTPVYVSGYNAQPRQPAVVYTPQPQYYTAPAQVNPYVNQAPPVSPATVYYNNQVGSAPQYHYGNPMVGGMMDAGYFARQQQLMEKRRTEQKKFRDIGNATGIASLLCFGLALLFSMLFFFDTVAEIYDGSIVGMSLIGMLYSIIVVGGSFLICKKSLDNMGNGKALKLENNMPKATPLSFAAPKDFKKTLLMIPIGLAGCMLANYVSTLILTFLGNFGIYSTYSAIEDPQNAIDVVALFLSGAIMPALIEELAIRGILMTPMRKYGNAFAVLASSYVFGVFHGDAAQIPFAFVCGLFLAYVAIVTDSIWPAVIVHALNNSLSCVSSALMTFVGEDSANTFYMIATLVILALGVLAFFLYIKKYKDTDFALFKSNAQDESLTLGQKFGRFMSSPAMIIMTVVYVIQAIGTLTTTPPAY